MTSEYKVALEVAEQEFIRMCAARRIDTDERQMKAKEKKDFLELKGAVVKLIQEGRLEVSETGSEVTYNTYGGQKFTFKKAGGSTLLALETHEGKNIANMYEALADMAGVAANRFTALDDIGDVGRASCRGRGESSG